MGVENGVVRKAGAWYTYDGDQLGQGKEKAREFLRENPDVAAEIEKKILEKLGVGPDHGRRRGRPRSPPGRLLSDETFDEALPVTRPTPAG